MTGATPAIHLTRSATIRMIENIQKVVPSMILSDERNQTAPEKKTYASVASTRPRHITQNQRLMEPRSHHRHTQWLDRSQTKSSLKSTAGSAEFQGIKRTYTDTKRQSDVISVES